MNPFFHKIKSVKCDLKYFLNYESEKIDRISITRIFVYKSSYKGKSAIENQFPLSGFVNYIFVSEKKYF